MWGNKKLHVEERIFFLLAVILVCYLQCISFILFAPVAKLVILIAAITLGSRKFPILIGFTLIPLFILLHFGKYEMRAKYWFGAERGNPISLAQVPFVLTEWYGHSLNYLLRSNSNQPPPRIRSDGSHQADRRFTERMSLMHMFLEVKHRAGTDVPLFYGKSYSLIPFALVPRVMNPRKISPHEAMYLINIEYGHQTRGNTRTTHKAWGLLAEAWANFGPVGLFLLAIFMGGSLGVMTVYTRNYPLLSFRGCFAALLCIATLSANSATLAVLLSSLLHSIVILVVITAIWMKPRPFADQ